MQWLFIILALLFGSKTTEPLHAPTEAAKAYMISKVNKLRAKGCTCGGERLKSVPPVEWDETLYESAMSHAKQMNRYNFFAHYSIDGLDIGDRLDKVGYDWAVAGENIGEGQRDFDEVLVDWIKSESHCRMLMNPKVNEMSVARSGRYWVQHFGRKIPRNARKRSRKRN